LSNLYSELIGPNPQSRPNPADIITRCRKLGGYFKNDLVDSLLFLEEIQIKDKNEKNRFFSNLTPHLDIFPDNICKQKILPQLITAFEYGDAGSAVLAPMFKVFFKDFQHSVELRQLIFSWADFWMKQSIKKKLCHVLLNCLEATTGRQDRVFYSN